MPRSGKLKIMKCIFGGPLDSFYAPDLPVKRPLDINGVDIESDPSVIAPENIVAGPQRAGELIYRELLLDAAATRDARPLPKDTHAHTHNAATQLHAASHLSRASSSLCSTTRSLGGPETERAARQEPLPPRRALDSPLPNAKI